MKKYLLFFSLHILSVVLWVVWALPLMNESGSLPDEATWLAAQILLPVFIFWMIHHRYRPGYWIALVWGLMVLLCGSGLLGWALMGPATPPAVYGVAGLLLLDGLGVFSSALQDLNWIRERKAYVVED